MAQIYARPIPPVERMQEVQRLVRDPKETPMDTIKAAQLIKQARSPVAYTPRSLSQAASQAQLPVTPRPASRPDPRLVPQPRVPANVPPPISPEDEAILMAQAGGRASIPQQVENLASKGRHGDTMLMHVNPQEFQGLSTLLGPTTTNPDTGLPEAFAWWLPLVGAAIGGVGAKVAGKDWKQGALYGGLLGLGGAGALSLGGASTAAGGLGSTWGPLGTLFSGTGAAGSAVAPLAGSAGASNLVPAVGTAGSYLGTGVPASAGHFGPLVSNMATKGAVQSAIPNIAAASPARVLDTKALAAQGGARNVTSPSSLLGRAWDWMKENPKETAAGAYGVASLLGSQQGYPPYTAPPIRKPAEFDISDIEPKKIRKARRLTEEEINKRILEGGDPSSLLEETDESAPISFANTGGLLSLARYGRNEDNAAHGGEVAHISADESNMLRRMGGAGSINPVTGLREYYTSGITGNPAAGTFAGTTAAQGSAAAAQGQGQSGQSGNFGFFVGQGGAVPTQGHPGGLSKPRPGPGYNPLSSSTYGQAQQIANMFAYDPGLTSIANMPFLQGTLALMGHAAEKGMRVGTLGTLASLGALGEGPQNLANAPTFSRGDVGITSSDVSGPVSPVNTQTQGGNQGVGIGEAVTETALPPPGLGPVVGQANGGIVGLNIGGFAGGPGTFGGAGVGGHEATHGAAHPSGHPHPQQIGQPQVVFYGRRRGSSGSGAPPPPAPFEFPEVNPFAGGASNFNAQDALSRIAGPNFQQVANTIPANIPVPPPVLDPATLSAAQGALSGLLNRASQSSFADVGGIQEALEQPSVIQNNTGGLTQFATGGEFAGHVQGVGDGMSDQIPFRVVPQTPQDIPNAPDMAVLSTDEYVFPADAVAMLGNGSSDAGAKILDSAVKNVRRASIGTPKQIKQIDGQKVLEGAMTT
jgi:hypothetical protein